MENSKFKSQMSKLIKEALKAHDDVRVSTLRLLSNALHNEEIAKPASPGGGQGGQKELSEEEELQIVRRQLKQRDEAIEAYTKGGRPEAAEKEKQEAEILKEFLPTQMDVGELEKIVEGVIAEVGATSPQDFGKVMGMVVARVKGQADGKTIAEMVKGKLKLKS